MFNNILIDKIRICFSLSRTGDLNVLDFVRNARNVLAEHFDSGAFSISSPIEFSSSFYNVAITFTPTRYGRHWSNMEMLTEEELLMLFRAMGFTEDNRGSIINCRLTRLDITKNFVVEYNPEEYLIRLKNMTLGTFKARTISSSNITSLYLSTLKKKQGDIKSYVGDRLFLFYDKGQELRTRKNIQSFIVNLSDREQALLPDGAYVNNELFVDSVNILRHEQQLRTTKLNKLAKKLGDEKRPQVFTILHELEQGNFYNILDDYYTETLNSVVFKDFNQNDINLTRKDKLLHHLLSMDSQSLDNLNVFNYLDYNTTRLKKVIGNFHTQDPLLNELFLLVNKHSDVISPISREFFTSSNSASDSDLLSSDIDDDDIFFDDDEEDGDI